MKSPLWIVTSALAIFLIAMIVFIAFSIRKVVERPRLAPLRVRTTAVAPLEGEAKPKDLQLIYEEKDLFGTFRPTFTPVKPVETLPVIPPPPTPRPVRPRVRPLVQFLEPLPVKISGIIASTDDSKSQVTVVNNNTKKSSTHRVGEKIIDATVIRIFPRKVLLVRSNGQQETLFMYPEDAQTELKNLKDPTWEDVVQRQGMNSYLLNPTTFASRIISLANFIDLTDMNIVTHEGKTTGVIIGKIAPKSIGFALGFQPGDFIVKIDGIAPTSTQNRMRIFNNILQSSLGTKITVEYKRQGQPLTNNYTLFNLADAAQFGSTDNPALAIGFGPQPQIMPQLPFARPDDRAQQPIQQERGAVNPVHEMQRRDREAMNIYGSMGARPMAPGQPMAPN